MASNGVSHCLLFLIVATRLLQLCTAKAQHSGSGWHCNAKPAFAQEETQAFIECFIEISGGPTPPPREANKDHPKSDITAETMGGENDSPYDTDQTTMLLCLAKKLGQINDDGSFNINSAIDRINELDIGHQLKKQIQNGITACNNDNKDEVDDIVSCITGVYAQYCQTEAETTEEPDTTTEAESTTNHESTTDQESTTENETTESSETTSEGSETTSEDSETTSEDSETTSEDSETTSEGSETTTEGSETTSEDSETTSEDSETTSEGSETTTEDSETTSEGLETTSEGSETTTENEETDAENETEEEGATGKETTTDGRESD